MPTNINDSKVSQFLKNKLNLVGMLEFSDEKGGGGLQLTGRLGCVLYLVCINSTKHVPEHCGEVCLVWKSSDAQHI